jgi:hypothetical protein
MLLPIAGAVLIGLPALALAVWFSWLVRCCWLSGGPVLVTGMWLLHLILISTICGVSGYPFLNVANHNALSDALRSIPLYAIAGSLPSGVIAVVVSCFAHLLPKHAILTVVAGILAGLAAGILWLPIVLTAESALR